MQRKIIKIDREKCNGCGLCAEACHEGAIQMIDGKAELIRDDYCDGLGDCLPVCPTDAISFEIREAAAYDQKAVDAHLARKKEDEGQGSAGEGSGNPRSPRQSELRQWPVQIQLAPINAPYFDGANLLIAADCAGFAYGDFHKDFIKNRVTLIGCPKLDPVDYSEKLTQILTNNDIQSLTVVRMEVPCCGGLEYAANLAMQNSGKMIPSQVITISTEGDILK